MHSPLPSCVQIQAQMEDKGVGLIDQTTPAPVCGLAENGSFHRSTGCFLASLLWLNQAATAILNKPTRIYMFRFIFVTTEVAAVVFIIHPSFCILQTFAEHLSDTKLCTIGGWWGQSSVQLGSSQPWRSHGRNRKLRRREWDREEQDKGLQESARI